MMTFRQYAKRSHPIPYVLDLRGARGRRLLYFGAIHSFDPRDRIFRGIERCFDECAPRLALNEGGDVPLATSRAQAIKRHGEAGFLRRLCAARGVPIESLDLGMEQEARSLAKRFPPRTVVLFFVLRLLGSYNRKTARDSFAEVFSDYVRSLSDVLGLRGLTWDEVRAEYARLFDRPLQPSRIRRSATNPTIYETRIQLISRVSNHLRDEHMVRTLARAVERKRRVLAVVGYTHVVMQERELLRATGLSPPTI